ncbi:MAG: hypothetical protein NC350_00730 [Corallococcus sp.]|nr:hypothetical protein [Corallococcus sp.]
MTQYLKSHFYKYPLMRTRDFIKLCCQQEFGRDRLLGETDEYTLEAEARERADVFEEIAVPVSDNYCRINLAPYLAAGYSFSTLSDMCKKITVQGTSEGVKKRLDGFLKQIEAGAIDFPLFGAQREVSAFLAKGADCQPHSTSYKLNYFPHYRLVGKAEAFLLPFIAVIDKLLYLKLNVTVAIDGHSGTGKTYYADILKRYYGSCTVIRCDDFFLPCNMRIEERLAEAGGNIHYEKLAKAIADAARGETFAYQKYDCKTDSYVTVTEKSNRLTIVEGVYALHPKLQNFYDASLLLTASNNKKRKRIIQREGNAKYGEFQQKWIPLENAYFETCRFDNAVLLNSDDQ